MKYTNDKDDNVQALSIPNLISCCSKEFIVKDTDNIVLSDRYQENIYLCRLNSPGCGIWEQEP